MWEAYRYWQEKAALLTDPNCQRKIIPYPPNFREFTPAELLGNSVIFASLIACYQKVFGSRDIWGEGAKCTKCGHLIPIEEFVDRKQRHDFVCSRCDGTYIQIFPAGFLQKRIQYELDSNVWVNPFIILFLNDEGTEVLGFCWGVVDTPLKIAMRITSNKYADNRDAAKMIREKILTTFSPDDQIVYYDEIGLRKEARGGIGPVASLVRLGLEKGEESHSKRALYWTARKSPIYMICRLSGYEDFFETSDGIVFGYSEDVIPLLRVIQYFSFDEQTQMVAEVAQNVLKM